MEEGISGNDNHIGNGPYPRNYRYQRLHSFKRRLGFLLRIKTGKYPNLFDCFTSAHVILLDKQKRLFEALFFWCLLDGSSAV